MTHHTTTDGVEIKLEDLKTGHLVNIIKKIKRQADEGFDVLITEETPIHDGRDSHVVDSYYDEVWQMFKGEEALKYLNFYEYDAEMRRRNLDWYV